MATKSMHEIMIQMLVQWLHKLCMPISHFKVLTACVGECDTKLKKKMATKESN